MRAAEVIARLVASEVSESDYKVFLPLGFNVIRELNVSGFRLVDDEVPPELRVPLASES